MRAIRIGKQAKDTFPPSILFCFLPPGSAGKWTTGTVISLSVMLHYLPWSVSVPAPRGSCKGFPQSATLPALPQRSSVQHCPLGSPWAAAPHVCTGRSALCGAHDLQGTACSSKGCREILLHSWSTSCPPPALLWHGAVLRHSCSRPSITTLPCKPNTLLFCYQNKNSTFKIL